MQCCCAAYLHALHLRRLNAPNDLAVREHQPPSCANVSCKPLDVAQNLPALCELLESLLLKAAKESRGGRFIKPTLKVWMVRTCACVISCLLKRCVIWCGSA
jgi:hypothetical protein